MDFKETYKKYLDGTATEEEKTFVEAEIERARLVNDEIIAATGVINNAPQVSKKKRTPFRIILKRIIIAVVSIVTVFLILFTTIYGLAFSNALDNIKVQPEEAKQHALEYAYMYARDHYGYTGSVMEMISSEVDPDSRELVFKFPFKKCHYMYEFEFIADIREFHVHVNSSTGMPNIVSIEVMD